MTGPDKIECKDLMIPFEEGQSLIRECRAALKKDGSRFYLADSILECWYLCRKICDYLKGHDSIEFLDFKKNLDAEMAKIPVLPIKDLVFLQESLPNLLVNSRYEDYLDHLDLLESVFYQLHAKITEYFNQSFFWTEGKKRVLFSLAIFGVLFVGANSFFRTYFAKPGPWYAMFYMNKILDGKSKFVHVHDKVAFDWGKSSPFKNFNNNRFSVKWISCLKVEKSRELTFILTSDDGSRLKIDDKIVLDQWRIQAKQTKTVKRIFKPGRYYKIALDYFEERGDAMVELKVHDHLLGDVQHLSHNFLILPKLTSEGNTSCPRM